MATFKSIWSAFRATRKPGIVNFGNFSPPIIANFPRFADDENADPLCDSLGSQWVRDAGKPDYFRDPGNVGLEAYPAKQQWEFFGNTGLVYIGQESGLGVPCALYDLQVVAGDASAWSAAPVYCQLFTPNNGVAPLPGAIPDYVMPVPRPPEMAVFRPGVDTPFNGVNGGSGGIAIALSSTPDTFTATAQVGAISVSWAFYSYSI